MAAIHPLMIRPFHSVTSDKYAKMTTLSRCATKLIGMDYEAARTNMIEQQIRPWNVLATQTLNALGMVKREDFVPEAYRPLAFADVQIPLDNGEVMLEPKLGARMIESLALQSTEQVLEIGTGSGYLSALLGTLCREVTSIEIDEVLHKQATFNLAASGIDNVTLVLGDCHERCNKPPQYDAVLITGSMPSITPALTDLVAQGGRLVGIEGHAPAMQVVRFTRSSTSLDKVSLFETNVRRLRNLNEKPEFEF